MNRRYAIAVIALAAILAGVVGVRSLTADKIQTGGTVADPATWGAKADAAQKALDQAYWDPKEQMFDNLTPCNDICNEQFNYWWQAHGVDVLVDGYQRTHDDRYKQHLQEMYKGILLRNGGNLPNQFYDDMEWMALAFLRAYDVTKDETYKNAALELWTDIKTGWNDEVGGGIAWRKTQLTYKNTPANAPAAILAARLYEHFGDAADLEWAKKIYAWEKANLVDPDSGFVWDGKNREGNGKIDKGWEFTYNQGVVIGAGVELYRATKDKNYLADAARTAKAAKERMTSPVTGMLPAEGGKDGGLFKGILVRYVTELILEDPSQTDLIQMLKTNADSLWKYGKAPDKAIFSQSWAATPDPAVELSVDLSGVMLLERMAVLEQRGLVH